MTDALGRVVAFVEAEAPPPRPRRIGPDTDLRGELRMDWCDAEELMVRFFDRFGVDRGGFVFQTYYPVERFKLLRNPFRAPPSATPLTLGLMARAVELGRWPQGDVSCADQPVPAPDED